MRLAARAPWLVRTSRNIAMPHQMYLSEGSHCVHCVHCVLKWGGLQQLVECRWRLQGIYCFWTDKYGAVDEELGTQASHLFSHHLSQFRSAQTHTPLPHCLSSLPSGVTAECIGEREMTFQFGMSLQTWPFCLRWTSWAIRIASHPPPPPKVAASHVSFVCRSINSVVTCLVNVWTTI